MLIKKMNTPIPKHESIIDFEASKVKEAIKKFLEINLGSDFREKSSNDIFGNYVISIFKNNSWNGFSTGNMHITVQELENKKTKIIVETQNIGKDQYVNDRDLAEAQSQFLNSLANILSGNTTPEAVVVPKGQGCLGVFLLLLCMGSLSFYYWLF